MKPNDNVDYMEYRIAIGRLVDKLIMAYRGYLIEKISFRDGLRYRLRLSVNDKLPVDLHVVNKFDKIFIELWPINRATPLLVLEKSINENLDSIYRELTLILSTLWKVKVRKHRKLIKKANSRAT